MLRKRKFEFMGSFLEQIGPTEEEPRPKKKRQLQPLRKLKNLKGAKMSETFFKMLVDLAATETVHEQ